MAVLKTKSQVRALTSKMTGTLLGNAKLLAWTGNVSPIQYHLDPPYDLKVGDVIFVSGGDPGNNVNGMRKVATLLHVGDVGNESATDFFTCTDFFSGAAVNTNGQDNGNPKFQRFWFAMTPGDIEDIFTTMDRSPVFNKARFLAPEKRPADTIASLFGGEIGQP